MRGPLLLAYPIPERREVDDVDHPELKGKRSKDPAFCSWNMYANGPFAYCLASCEIRSEGMSEGGYGFDPDSGRLTVVVPGRKIVWGLEEGKYTPDLPRKVRLVDGAEEPLRLVPYGATCLRLAVFPLEVE